MAANDSDPDGDLLTLVDLGAPAHGSVVDNGDGTVTYTPNADFNGGQFLNGQTGSVAFRVNGVRATNANANGAAHTTVFAGQYSDVVTITVTAR